MIRLSGSQGANPWASITHSGDGYRTTTQLMSTPSTTAAIETKEAVYFFFIFEDKDTAQVTKVVRKGQKGYDCSSSTTVAQARKWYKQLVTR